MDHQLFYFHLLTADIFMILLTAFFTFCIFKVFYFFFSYIDFLFECIRFLCQNVIFYNQVYFAFVSSPVYRLHCCCWDHYFSHMFKLVLCWFYALEFFRHNCDCTLVICCDLIDICSCWCHFGFPLPDIF